MIFSYSETFFSKLQPDIQEQLYLCFKSAPPRDKILLFTKFKYGDEITFKEISEKMHTSMVRTIYTEYIETVKSGLIS